MPQALEVFEAPLQASVQANVELDIRYLFYIKKYGPPPGGVFDPVKLAEFVNMSLTSDYVDVVTEDASRYGDVPENVDPDAGYH